MLATNEHGRESMLLQFSVKNYKSFGDETVIDLTATNIKEHNNSLIEINGIKVLPVAAIFGANASGKSNLFSAFKSMSFEVINFNKIEKHILVTPHIFNKDLELEPTEYQIIISIGDKEYRYGFVRNQEKVFEEWLFTKKFAKNTKAKEKLIFYRDNKNISIDKLNKKERDEITYIYSMTEESELLITAIGRREKSEYVKIYEWFLHTAQMQNFSNDFDEVTSRKALTQFLYEKEEHLKDVTNLLKKFDSAIVDIIIKPEKDSDLNEDYVVYSLHIDNNGEDNLIPFESESSGTKKMFALASWLYFSLKSGMVLWVDELDAKLHPLILRYIIKMFSDREINTGNGQLIFSSHNLVCLDSSDLRRDEIWFVEKINQNSELYSLYDFKEEDIAIRSDLSFGKHYLSGRFGAIPFQDVGE